MNNLKKGTNKYGETRDAKKLREHKENTSKKCTGNQKKTLNNTSKKQVEFKMEIKRASPAIEGRRLQLRP